MSSEIVDLVGPDDVFIRQIEREDFWQTRPVGGSLRLVQCFVQGPNRQLWVPQRAAKKRVLPLHWEIGAGGHVLAGESYQAAFFREVEEELGLRPQELPWQELGHLPPTEENPYQMRLYLLQVQTAPQLNRADFERALWLTPAELTHLIERETATPILRRVLPWALEKKWI